MVLTEQIILTKNIWQRIRYLNPLVYNENKTNLKILICQNWRMLVNQFMILKTGKRIKKSSTYSAFI